MVVFGIPIEIFYLIILLGFITLVFMGFKRPIYEALFLGYLLTIIMTQRYDLFLESLIEPHKVSLFYIIVTFLVLAHILNETKVVEKLIQIVISIFGRLPGGAGVVALLGSSTMAMMSGTGPGNVAATGVFTIPAMIKTGFPRELAATVSMAGSSLGNQMGPGLNLIVFGILSTIYPGKYSLGSFWLALWAVGGWLLIQRFLILIYFIKRYKLKPIPKEQIIPLKQAFKEGWKATIIPLIILIPLLFSTLCDNFIISRLGEAGSRIFSSSLLMFVSGIACLYSIIIGKNNIPGGLKLKCIIDLFMKTIKGVVPVSAAIYFAYSISLVFGKIEMQSAVQNWFLSLGFGTVGWAILVTMFTTFLGMVLPGSAQVTILGSAIILTGAAVGLNPFFIAAILPALTGVAEGMTPPMALCLFAAMGIAKSGFKETASLAWVWVIGHAAISIVLLLGFLPILSHY